DRERIVSTNNGAKGVVGPMLVTTGGRVLMRTRMDADNGFRLHGIDTDGDNLGVLPGSDIPREDSTVADIGSIGVSPDGSTLAFAADPILSAYEVYVMPIDGGQAPRRVTAGTASPGRNPSFFYPLRW